MTTSKKDKTRLDMENHPLTLIINYMFIIAVLYPVFNVLLDKSKYTNLLAMIRLIRSISMSIFWPFLVFLLPTTWRSFTEVQKVILRCLVWLKMHYFKGSLPKWVLTPEKETSSHVFKMFGYFMSHIIR